MNNFFKYRTRTFTSFVVLFNMIIFTIGTLAPFSCLPVHAAPMPGGDDAIHIATVQDLQEFSRNCATDSWSVGKLFVLDN
ncbi:MAG: hypothetical protein K2G19_06445, partial [Lachnospiraceae bacterium]|nr:hypothetical protein [Lachnospiraceae bacterium]